MLSQTNQLNLNLIDSDRFWQKIKLISNLMQTCFVFGFVSKLVNVSNVMLDIFRSILKYGIYYNSWQGQLHKN